MYKQEASKMKKFMLCIIVVLLFITMIITGCGGDTSPNTVGNTTSVTEPSPSKTVSTTLGPDSYLRGIATTTALSLRAILPYSQNVDGEPFDFTLKDDNKTFLIISLAFRTPNKEITLYLSDILVSDGQESYPVVGCSNAGYGFLPLASLGSAQVVMELDSIAAYYNNCVFVFDPDNDYGILCADYTLKKAGIHSIPTILGCHLSGPRFVFVVPKSSVIDGNLWLELPNSPQINLPVLPINEVFYYEFFGLPPSQ
jgi:hypothetical protein